LHIERRPTGTAREGGINRDAGEKKETSLFYSGNEKKGAYLKKEKPFELKQLGPGRGWVSEARKGNEEAVVYFR